MHTHKCISGVPSSWVTPTVLWGALTAAPVNAELLWLSALRRFCCQPWGVAAPVPCPAARGGPALLRLSALRCCGCQPCVAVAVSPALLRLQPCAAAAVSAALLRHGPDCAHG